MIRVHYEVQGGPIEPILRMRTNRGAVRDYDLRGSGMSGTQGHMSDQTTPACSALSTADDDGSINFMLFGLEGGDLTDDSDPDQRIRFCVEKVTDTCEDPCSSGMGGTRCVR